MHRQTSIRVGGRRSKHYVARALVHLLTFMAQPGHDNLSRQLLEKLADRTDDVTRGSAIGRCASDGVTTEGCDHSCAASSSNVRKGR